MAMAGPKPFQHSALPERQRFSGHIRHDLVDIEHTGHGNLGSRRSMLDVHRCRSSTVNASSPTSAAEVRAVLFDMDGVLCNSEIVSRKAAAEVMKELYGLDVDPAEFIPYTGTGEANFLGGVARKYGAPFEVESCKAKFFEIYMAKYAVPGAGIGYPGARDLVEACRAAGLRTAVASSADLVKVHANLLAADIPLDIFDAIVSADLFERLKPFPDIFLAAASQVGIDPENCVVIEDAIAGVEAARAAGMRVIGVTTTMEEGAMELAGPDAMLPQISAIDVGRIMGLELCESGKEAIKAAKSKSQSSLNEYADSDTITSTTSESSGGVQDWLNEFVSLPAGYKTTRRDALKFLSLGAGGASLWVALTRAKGDPTFRRTLRRFHIPALIQLGIFGYVAAAWGYWSKSLSYASPKALLNELLPRASPPPPEAGVSRVAAFKRFISDIEARGGGEEVPEFPPNADWLNAPPLRLDRELRGKVVILDFWTYCCVNCMHILPDLEYIDQKYSTRPVTVVGVHSAKFDAEKDTAAIKSAVLRYDVRHPVVNDAGMVLWRALGVSSWPTLVVVSPRGRILLSLPGEGHRQDIDDIVEAALEYYGEAGMLDDSPVPSQLEREKDSRLTTSALRFPGKVATDGNEGGRLFVADSGNHRILIIDSATGKFVEAIGGNGPGLEDGVYETCCFNKPQGMAYSHKRNILYVCDTESHAVRAVDLTQRSVRTLVGNGTKGGDYFGGRAGTGQQLNSPWDCVLVPSSESSLGSLSSKEALYVAMAGQHQIWRVDIDSGVAENFSGSGYERNQNGASPASTAWAQPSGLAFVPGTSTIYVADSESSSIRKLDLSTGGSSSCVGGDPLFSDNLFKFGDADGSGTSALLQHPLAVAAASTVNGTTTAAAAIYVADSYNHKLKRIDPATCAITTLAGSGQAGFKDGVGEAAQLSEPGGLAIAPDGRTVFIADTNNSLIRKFDPQTNTLSTLQLINVPPPRVSPDAGAAWTGGSSAGQTPPGAAVVKARALKKKGRVEVSIALPAGYHLTQGANSRFETSWRPSSGTLGAGSNGEEGVVEPAAGPLKETTTAINGSSVSAVVEYNVQNLGILTVLCTVYFCQDRSVCLFEEVAFQIEVVEGRGNDEMAASGGDHVQLSYELSSKAPVVNLP